MTRTEIYNNLLEAAENRMIGDLTRLFNNDESLFNRTIEELDSYMGYLDDERYYSMVYDFDDLLCGLKPLEIVDRIDWSNFNSNDDYFQFGICGIKSSDYIDYSDLLDDNFCLTLYNYWGNLCLDYEVEEIIEKYENRVEWLKNRQ